MKRALCLLPLALALAGCEPATPSPKVTHTFVVTCPQSVDTLHGIADGTAGKDGMFLRDTLGYGVFFTKLECTARELRVAK